MSGIMLSEPARARLSLGLTVLVWILTFLGAGITAFGGYVKIFLWEYSTLVMDYDGTTLPVFLFVTGIIVAFSNAAGGLLLLKLSNPAARKSFRQIFVVFVVVLAVVTVLILTAAIMCFLHVDHLHDSFQGGIAEAMLLYGDKIDVKMEIDHLQMRFQCCGNDNYNEWQKIGWTKHSQDSVPFSCCDPKSLRPCVSNRIHDNDAHASYDYRNDLTIHQTGCRESLMNYYSVIFNTCASVIMVMAALELLVLLLARYLQTSMSEALDLGDPMATAAGYIIYPEYGEKDILPYAGSKYQTLDTGSNKGTANGAISVKGSILPTVNRSGTAPSVIGSNMSRRSSAILSQGVSKHRSLDERMSIRRESEMDDLTWNTDWSTGDSNPDAGAAPGVGNIPIPPPPPPLPNY